MATKGWSKGKGKDKGQEMKKRKRISRDMLEAEGERCRGKKARVMDAEPREAVLWRKEPAGGHLGRVSCVWYDCIYLNVKEKAINVRTAENEMGGIERRLDSRFQGEKDGSEGLAVLAAKGRDIGNVDGIGNILKEYGYLHREGDRSVQ